jgi:hypothetical protein
VQPGFGELQPAGLVGGQLAAPLALADALLLTMFALIDRLSDCWHRDGNGSDCSNSQKQFTHEIHSFG